MNKDSDQGLKNYDSWNLPVITKHYSHKVFTVLVPRFGTLDQIKGYLLCKY